MSSIILTNHAKQRIADRSMSQSQVRETILHPTSVKRSLTSGQKTFTKKLGKQTVTVVAALNNKAEWIVMSCWIDPPNAGTRDERDRNYWQQYKKASFFGKFWIVLKKQLGL